MDFFSTTVSSTISHHDPAPFRLSPLLKTLSYPQLVQQQAIPAIPAHFSVGPKKYPPWVYQSKSFPFFGLWMDYVVRAGLRLFLSFQPSQFNESQELTSDAQYHEYCTSTDWPRVIFLSYQLVCQQFQEGSPYSYEQITGYIPTLTKMIKDLVGQWTKYGPVLTSGPICSEVEFRQDDLAGHPDIVVRNPDGSVVILDIKCSANFATYQEHSWLQILGYVALARAKGTKVQYTGLVMPLQRVVNLVDLTNWDSSLYLGILMEKVSEAQRAENAAVATSSMPVMEQILTSLYELVMDPNRHTISNTGPSLLIGHHIHKPKVLAVGFKDYALANPGCATQLFLTARGGKCSQKTLGQLEAGRAAVMQHQLPLFVHAPYCINLCANEQDQITGRFWQQEILNMDLWMTNRLGGRGVIVHTGARVHRTEEEAMKIMEGMVRAALPYATSECPLLLETPVGEGTEVCTEIQNLGTFFYRFTEEERNKLAICVDTCHVFASGVDPLVYLDHWETHCKIKIGLIHFNDSKSPMGSHVDRHAPVGMGYIGSAKMMAVGEWCQLRKIPLVVE